MYVTSIFQNHQPSPRSTPNSSPRSAKSPPPSRSAPPTPGSTAAHTMCATDVLTGDVRSAFSGSSTSGGESFVIFLN